MAEDRLTGTDWERAIVAKLGADHRTNGLGDVLTPQGTLIEVKRSLHGARDLQAAATQLAMSLGDPSVRRALLVAHLPRMSATRAAGEWESVLGVLRPELAARLALIADTTDGGVLLPVDDEEVRRIGTIIHDVLGSASSRAPREATHQQRWTPTTYEVWKVLLGAWLRREPPLPLHELEHRAGASYPTVAAVLRRLEQYGELERTSSRSAGFTRAPRRSLAEVLALGDGLRETHRFVDKSGGETSTSDLARRIASKAPNTVAFGGVEGARHYAAGFDLNGLPRVDVSVVENDDLAWMKKVDPALVAVPAVAGAASPLVVVHRLRRPESAFVQGADGRRIADPAEVLLDLHELRLSDQAHDFVQTMRAEVQR